LSGCKKHVFLKVNGNPGGERWGGAFKKLSEAPRKGFLLQGLIVTQRKDGFKQKKFLRCNEEKASRGASMVTRSPWDPIHRISPLEQRLGGGARPLEYLLQGDAGSQTSLPIPIS